MNTKLFVENLAAATSEYELEALFAVFGNVAAVNIARDRITRKPSGLGYVTMATPEGARAAVQGLHGKAIGTNTIGVSEARPNEGRVPSRQTGPLF